MSGARSSRRLPVALAAGFVACSGLLLLAQAQRSPAPAGGARRIEVLVLSRSTAEHDTSRLAPVLKAGLSQYGFNISSAGAADAITDASLAPYDALILGANLSGLTTDDVRAIAGFVASGKGLLAVHAAGAPSSPNTGITALLGGSVERRGAATVTPAFVAQGHPVLANLKPFPSTGESIVVAPDAGATRTVLMETVEGATRQPWTWVRGEGQGRVFYTSYGHDEATCASPEFQSLL